MFLARAKFALPLGNEAKKLSVVCDKAYVLRDSQKEELKKILCEVIYNMGKCKDLVASHCLPVINTCILDYFPRWSIRLDGMEMYQDLQEFDRVLSATLPVIVSSVRNFKSLQGCRDELESIVRRTDANLSLFNERFKEMFDPIQKRRTLLSMEIAASSQAMRSDCSAAFPCAPPLDHRAETPPLEPDQGLDIVNYGIAGPSLCIPQLDGVDDFTHPEDMLVIVRQVARLVVGDEYCRRALELCGESQEVYDVLDAAGNHTDQSVPRSTFAPSVLGSKVSPVYADSDIDLDLCNIGSLWSSSFNVCIRDGFSVSIGVQPKKIGDKPTSDFICNMNVDPDDSEAAQKIFQCLCKHVMTVRGPCTPVSDADKAKVREIVERLGDALVQCRGRLVAPSEILESEQPQTVM